MGEEHPARRGTIYAVSAFAWWGFFPLYFRLLSAVPAVEILAHRVLWTCLSAWVLNVVLMRGGLLRLWRGGWKRTSLLVLSGASIAANWLVFVWAVTHGQVLETSLGYFVSPLLSVVLGVVILRERLRPAQAVAVLLAALAVANLLIRHGRLPWVALSLAATFGLYGLLRKQIAVDSLGGLLVEMTALLPLAAGYLAYLACCAASSFPSQGAETSLLLIGAGPVTAFPLIIFAAGARRIRLSTLGFIQYLTPSLTFLTAVFLLRESLDWPKLLTFVVIWIALAIFSIDAAVSHLEVGAGTAASCGEL